MPSIIINYHSQTLYIDPPYPLPVCFHALLIVDYALPMGQIVFELPFVGDRVVEVVDYSPSELFSFPIFSHISQAVFKFIFPFAVLLAVFELAIIDSLGLFKYTCVISKVPSPWNWFFELNCPLYSY